MNSQIYSYILLQEKVYPVQVYGYSTRSIPGLEIIGLQGQSKALKNKIIYFCRKNNLRIPPQRYVIGYEDFSFGEKLSSAKKTSLELPTLLLFLNLCGVLPLVKIENCFSSGTFTINGTLKNDQQVLNKLDDFFHKKNLIYIGGSEVTKGRNISLTNLSKSLMLNR